MIDTFKRIIRHNQVVSCCVVVSVVLFVWAYGCQVTTTNPFNPKQKVTGAELKVEVDNYVNKITLAYDDLEQKEAIKQLVFNSIVDAVQGGNINPVGVLTTLSGIIGVGAVIDNRRKDSVIKAKNCHIESLTTVKKGKVT